ncbi:hypothetical protein [Emticicia sp. BO119]|uniref:hypothetical protein n=1 Tax=Emticicia sp. BO119 TaxID=2757768 RepID=UPI0015F0D6DD|nr:hypothetical protein [Emticicia sp. BO119]MBA4851009.1 hypothetical protein [Emticicia sp. BO119]
MKKHPIDELFARKLAEHRQEPSQKAFEKFQARLQEKQARRRGGVLAMNRNWGYYAAAAGIIAALTIGVLSQRNTNDIVVADTEKPKTGVPVQKPASPITQDNSSQIAQTNIEDKKELNTVRQALSVKSANDIVAAKRFNVPAKAPAVKEIASPIDEGSIEAIALNKPEEVQTNPLQAEILTSRNTTDVATYADNNSSITNKYNPGETVVVVITPIEETAVQAPVETETMAEKAEKEKSFLAKLYGEYKHFKYGEKVDLKGIGVKDAMAKVDDNLFKEEREDVRDFVQRRIGRMQKRE